jgi:hypothetical protein
MQTKQNTTQKTKKRLGTRNRPNKNPAWKKVRYRKSLDWYLYIQIIYKYQSSVSDYI